MTETATLAGLALAEILRGGVSRCTVCGGGIDLHKQRTPTPTHLGKRCRTMLSEKLCGCPHCGHAMFLENKKLRDLTRDEAAQVDAKVWMRTAEYHVGKTTWG